MQNCRFATAILHHTQYTNCRIQKPVMRETQIVGTRFVDCGITMPILQRAVILNSDLNTKKLADANTEGLVVM